MTEGVLYRGRVFHRRARPRVHAFRYRVFWLLLDLDRLEREPGDPRLLSVGKWNLLSVEPKDHGDGSETPLRAQVDARLAEVGVALDGGSVHLLTMPRVLGFVFNPISVYYCRESGGRLAAVIYEVTSTFGERHAYVLPVDDNGSPRFRQACAKALHVSPFIGMEMQYEFRGAMPRRTLALEIDAGDADGLLIATGLKADRRPLTDGEIVDACLALPFSTAKVVAGIHWEAFKLWLKRVPLVPRPGKVATVSGVREPDGEHIFL